MFRTQCRVLIIIIIIPLRIHSQMYVNANNTIANNRLTPSHFSEINLASLSAAVESMPLTIVTETLQVKTSNREEIFYICFV